MTRFSVSRIYGRQGLFRWSQQTTGRKEWYKWTEKTLFFTSLSTLNNWNTSALRQGCYSDRLCVCLHHTDWSKLQQLCVSLADKYQQPFARALLMSGTITFVIFFLTPAWCLSPFTSLSPCTSLSHATLICAKNASCQMVNPKVLSAGLIPELANL